MANVTFSSGATLNTTQNTNASAVTTSGDDTITGSYADFLTSTIDGGGGSDRLTLTGVSAGTVDLSQATNVETFWLNGILGETVSITTQDGWVSSGARISVGTSTITFSFDASAETDGSYSVYGRLGNDTIIGGAGNDSLSGFSGNDSLNGGTGDDRLDGGIGNDLIMGGSGADTLTGDMGSDTFVYAASGNGIDRIMDFGTSDVIRVTGRSSSGGTVTTGNGTNVAANSVQVANNVTTTTLYIDTDGNAGAAELSIVLSGSYGPSDFALSGTDISYVGSGSNPPGTIIFTGNATVSTSASTNANTTTSQDSDSISGTYADFLTSTIDGGGGGDRLTLTGVSAGTVDLGNASNIESFLLNGTLGTGVSITMQDGWVPSGTTRTFTTSTLTFAFDASAETDGAVVVHAAQGNDTITGGAGNDSLGGGTGNDSITGGSGDDTLGGGWGDDTLTGGSGNDALSGGIGDDILTGGAGNDSFYGDSGSDVFVYAGSGNGIDHIHDFGTGDVIRVTGRDASGGTVTIGDGSNVAANSVQIAVSGGNTTLYVDTDGNAGAAELTLNLSGIYATSDFSLSGTDISYAGSGTNSSTITFTGNATLSTTLSTNANSTTSSGSNYITGTYADFLTSTIDGGGGDDRLTLTGVSTGTVDLGNASNIESFLLNGTLGTSVSITTQNGWVPSGTRRTFTTSTLTFTFDASAETDGAVAVYAAQGNDSITGSAGNDTIAGGFGNDSLSGGAGADLLLGGLGNDIILGGDGSDTLVGGDGSDSLTGGGGGDIFYFAPPTDADTITDFGTGDVIRVSGRTFSAGAISSGNGTNVAANAVQIATSGGNTTLYIDADGSAGAAELTLTLTGTYSAANFSLSGTDISYYTPPPPTNTGGSDSGSSGGSGTTTSGGTTTTSVPTTSTTVNVDLASGGGASSLSALVPAGTSLKAEGPSSVQTPTQAQTIINTALQSRIADTATLQTVQTQLSTFLSSQPSTTQMAVRTITPAVSGAAAPTAPIVITGDTASDTGEALVIDARSLPAGSQLQLDNVDFAVVVGSVSVIGGAGKNYVVGDDGTQSILCGEDDDTLHGGAGDDSVGSRTGNDLVYGDEGNDTVFGGEDNDSVYGGVGNDSGNGNQGNDLVSGNQGNDTLHGGQGNDTVYGGQNDDQVFGDLGDDQVFGDLGDDAVYGGQGNDVVNGNAGADTVYGGQNNDTVHGGQGNDRLFGDLGDDQLWGDLGNDTLTGGAGANVFAFASGSGHDVITDFDVGSDRILFAAGQSWSVSANSAGYAVITFTQNDSVTLNGIGVNQISASLFVAG